MEPIIKTVRERPLGIAEIAELCGVKPQTAAIWGPGQRDLLPPADGRLSGVSFWYESTIREWARETGRL